MKINKISDGNTLTIQLDGKLDTTTAPELSKELETALTGVTNLRLGFAWPLISEDYIHRAVNSLETLGFFD